jgi:hypothetical protein
MLFPDMPPRMDELTVLRAEVKRLRKLNASLMKAATNHHLIEENAHLRAFVRLWHEHDSDDGELVFSVDDRLREMARSLLARKS